MGLDYAKTIEKWDVLEATISGPNEEILSVIMDQRHFLL